MVRPHREHLGRAPDVALILRAILLIAAHHEKTRQRLRSIVANQLMGPAPIGVDESDRLTRSALVSSQLIGLCLMRYIWEIEPLASMPDHDVITAIGSTIQRYIDGDLNLGRTDSADGNHDGCPATARRISRGARMRTGSRQAAASIVGAATQWRSADPAGITTSSLSTP